MQRFWPIVSVIALRATNIIHRLSVSGSAPLLSMERQRNRNDGADVNVHIRAKLLKAKYLETFAVNYETDLNQLVTK